ncbi:hypothetical protein O0S10_08325 [Methanocorpusculum sp. MG]|uniref:CopG family transcriptional regulator n=1 Tax=Methanocorpusculum petauri TaxID=3002863 RepID=A0ABT4IIY2_9EURY|nr:hypothetical protein [Methanocorpusculum petauri]MCZ0861222.1 hypothetical protein [Methanocorpusculum petauri]MDE2442911.1 hypothetical protein [Methanocorpusculum sp.]MDE2517828.1 hypothetical protein [Methanocorpusculum sp.]
MPASLWREIEVKADEAGISAVAWIRRACQEKLSRDCNAEKSSSRIVNEEEMRKLVREILREEIDKIRSSE